MSFSNRRVSIRDVSPQVDGGRYPAKRSLSEVIDVEADVFADSHDVVAAAVAWRRLGQRTWHEAPMEPLVNDRWRGSFEVDELGRYEFRVSGWIDRFGTWQRDTSTKLDAGVATEVDLLTGAELLEELIGRAKGEDRARLRELCAQLRDEEGELAGRAAASLTEESDELVRRLDRRRHAATSERLQIRVDRDRARYSTWYELFPRSTAREPGRHGTFDDVIAHLPYVASMNFDVLYLPPIHPIGETHRKGANNRVEAEPGEPGSPWAIGSEDGGHTSIHPDLGTLEDFRRLVAACADHGLELALDIAFQCSPDHPWVKEHPEWFRQRPDGSIQYAENPPKKYQDIYPLDFETEDVEGLWTALKDVFEYWLDQGVKIFRVDNPHTKAFGFWEWCIDELTREHPGAIFLSESFTRPKVMKELARVGFTQSYTYFAWRNHKWEIEEYYRELFHTDVADYFRPNSWPNTPDILTPYLQHGGRPAFVQKLVLAATLTANYGIYGPPFELMLNEARPGAEEYLDNEKYEVHHWDLDRPNPFRELIARINRIRRDNPALQQDRLFDLHHIDNDQLLIYSKTDRDRENVVLVVVNLDTTWRQSGTTWLDMAALGLPPDATFEVHDRIGEARYVWHGPDNYVELDPQVSSAHVFVVRNLDRMHAPTTSEGAG